MKKLILLSLSLFLMTTLSGCGLMEDAFKAGVIFALIIIAIIGAIIWAVNMAAKQIGKKYTVQIIPVKAKRSTREV